MPKRKTPEQYYNECKEKGLDLPIEDYINNSTKIKHKCSKGHTYKQTPSKHLRGQGCPKCNGSFKKTSKEYYNLCKEKGYDLPIEDYVNSYTKIKHKCSKGHIYTQIPSSHLSGYGCSKCKGNHSYTPKEYYDLCKEKGLDLPIEDYINATTKIKHKCSKGHIYEQIPSNHLREYGCPKCIGTYSYTSKEYYNLCKEKHLDLPIEDYINATTRIRHRCNKGHIYEQRPYAHLSGMGCPYCRGNHSYTPEEYYNECKEKGYDLPIEDYINAATKIKHKCSKGHIYEQRPQDHLQGRGCSKCNGNFKKTSEQYIKECKEKHLDLPIEDYTNAKTKIKHKCNKGHIYEQSPDMHTGTKLTGCPICNESHGEKFIRNYLDKNNIKYIPQKTFKDLKDKTYLSYDFYLPDYNILIEYQGIQHYEGVKFNGKNSSDLDKQKLHDKMKKDYAKNNGYKLLELKYTLNTQELVDKYLKRRLR